MRLLQSTVLSAVQRRIVPNASGTFKTALAWSRGHGAGLWKPPCHSSALSNEVMTSQFLFLPFEVFLLGLLVTLAQSLPGIKIKKNSKGRALTGTWFCTRYWNCKHPWQWRLEEGTQPNSRWGPESTWCLDLLRLRFFVSQCSRNSARGKVIGMK